jgi:plastocyanin
VRPRSKRGLAALAAAVTLVGCGDDEPGLEVPPADVVLVAEDNRFDLDRIDVVAGVDTTIAVENRDDGVNHNLHLYDVPGQPSTDLEQGPIVQVLEVTIDEIGSYHFICDLHPNMTGDVVVSGPAA